MSISCQQSKQHAASKRWMMKCPSLYKRNAISCGKNSACVLSETRSAAIRYNTRQRWKSGAASNVRTLQNRRRLRRAAGTFRNHTARNGGRSFSQISPREPRVWNGGLACALRLRGGALRHEHARRRALHHRTARSKIRRAASARRRNGGLPRTRWRLVIRRSGFLRPALPARARARLHRSDARLRARR